MTKANPKVQIEFVEFQSAINHILTTPICTQCWLGYADVMFLGFGELTIVEEPANTRYPNRHPQPEYELNTDYCDWEVTVCGESVGSSYDDPEAKAGAQALVGKRLLRWECLTSGQAFFEFDENTLLTLTPYEDPDKERDEVWDVRGNDGWYTFICGNGKTYRVPPDTLLRDWTA